MTKIGVSISIDIIYFNYCKENNINISKWVNNKMEEEFLDYEKKIEKLEREKSALNKKISDLQRQKDKKKKEAQEKIENLTPEQKKELETSIKILKEKGMGYLEGRYNRYKNLFGYITIEEFKRLIESF